MGDLIVSLLLIIRFFLRNVGMRSAWREADWQVDFDRIFCPSLQRFVELMPCELILEEADDEGLADGVS